MQMVRHDYDLRARVELHLRAAMVETIALVTKHRGEIVLVLEELVRVGVLDRDGFLDLVEGGPRLRLSEG